MRGMNPRTLTASDMLGYAKVPSTIFILKTENQNARKQTLVEYVIKDTTKLGRPGCGILLCYFESQPSDTKTADRFRFLFQKICAI